MWLAKFHTLGVLCCWIHFGFTFLCVLLVLIVCSVCVIQLLLLCLFMNVGGGCEVAVTTTTRCGWVEFMECDMLLRGRNCSPWLKGAGHSSYVRPAMLNGSEAWCLNENGTGILRRTERSMVGAICGIQLKDRKIKGFDVGFQ